jgi:8-oxo-dGTP pyrophosphatase MutT (NUDIX family)
VAAARELREETGISCDQLTRVSRWLRVRSWIEIVTIWHGTSARVEVGPTKETLRASWLAPDALPVMPRFVRARIEASPTRTTIRRPARQEQL